MAVYNGAKYVCQAIDSILAQTLADFELVIVNDGSSDETPRILDSYRDPRIVLVKNARNLGLTKSLNRGIHASSGELIARQDADDVSLPSRLAQQVAFMDAHPAIGLVGSGSRWINGQDALIREWQPPTGPAEIQQTLLTSIPFLHGTFTFRRDCLQDIEGGYDETLPVAQDCDLLLRISERWDLASLPDILYIHRLHEDTVTAKRKTDQQRYHYGAKQAAIRRRLTYGWGRLGLSKAQVPEWVQSANRHWMAQRFVWWSAAAREISRMAAAQFLLIALLFDPLLAEGWSYIKGIMRRKMQRHVTVTSSKESRGSS